MICGNKLLRSRLVEKEKWEAMKLMLLRQPGLNAKMMMMQGCLYLILLYSISFYQNQK